MTIIANNTIDFAQPINQALYHTDFSTDLLPLTFTHINKLDLNIHRFTDLFNGAFHNDFSIRNNSSDCITILSVQGYGQAPDAATPSAVPEPSTMALLSTVLMLGVLVRKFGFDRN